METASFQDLKLNKNKKLDYWRETGHPNYSKCYALVGVNFERPGCFQDKNKTKQEKRPKCFYLKKKQKKKTARQDLTSSCRPDMKGGHQFLIMVKT